METRTLGKSGVQLTALGFGCGPNARLMVTDDQALREETVAKALELGLNYFDTAEAYHDPGQPIGVSENNLARTLKALGAKPAISSKFLVTEETIGDVRGSVLRSFEGTLSRLGVDHLDAYVMHNRVDWERHPGQVVGIGPLLSVRDVLDEKTGCAAAFAELKASGVVRSVGLTGLGGVQSAVDELLQSGLFDCINAGFSIVRPTAGYAVVPSPSSDADYRSLIDRAGNVDLGVMVIQVFGGGLLFGRPANPPSPRVDRVRKWLESENLSPSDIALRWALGKAGVTAVIIGFSQPQHVIDAIEAERRGPLPAELSEELMSVIAADD